MSGFSHKYNTDDVLIRAIIVGLVNSMNEKISFTNVISDTESKVVNVPFYYNFSGDERFIQEYFQDWSDCLPQMIEGNYDPIPRGSLMIGGVSVVNANMTSRFVRGNFVREEKGELLRYNSYLNSIPMSLIFNVDVLVDTSLDAFKITQSIIKTFYKTLTFRVNFGGVVIPSQAGFSEAYDMQKLVEYTYGDDTKIHIKFDIEVESYYPIFDSKQEMFGGNRIEKTAVGVTAMANPLPTPTLETDYRGGTMSGGGLTGSLGSDSSLGVRNEEFTTEDVPLNIDLPGNPLDRHNDSLYSGNFWQ